jgi:hypothetical protein
MGESSSLDRRPTRQGSLSTVTFHVNLLVNYIESNLQQDLAGLKQSDGSAQDAAPEEEEKQGVSMFLKGTAKKRKVAGMFMRESQPNLNEDNKLEIGFNGMNKSELLNSATMEDMTLKQIQGVSEKSMMGSS